MNFNLYGFGPAHDRKWIVVDLGITFGDQTTPGVEVILPDPTFMEENADRLLGIVLTHAHEDHIGAVAWLWPRFKAPIYATPFTAFILREKLREAGLLDEAKITEVPLGGKIYARPLRAGADHAHPLDPRAQRPGDPHAAGHDPAHRRLEDRPGSAAGRASPTRTPSASSATRACWPWSATRTNVFVDGHAGSEAEVREALIPLIGSLKGKVAVACFASNVARMDSIARAAEANGRRVCLAGRSMHRMSAAAKSVGLMQGLQPFLDDSEAKKFPADKVLYLCTGSQGEGGRRCPASPTAPIRT